MAPRVTQIFSIIIGYYELNCAWPIRVNSCELINERFSGKK